MVAAAVVRASVCSWLVEMSAGAFVASTTRRVRPVASGRQAVEQQAQEQRVGEASRQAFNAVVQSTYARYPVTISRGSGCTLYDDEASKAYLDFVAGIATCCLGHGDRRLASAISEQIGRVHHVSNLYYIPEQGELAAWLVSKTRGASRAFFCNSGGEANEAAIKLALKYAVAERGVAKPIVLTAHGSFHGRTMATISATAQPKYHGPDGCWRIGGLFEHFDYNDVASARALFETHKGRIAAVLIEPIQGEGGVKPGDPAFFAELRALCDREGALLMIDEVQAGVGRTGRMWGHDHVLLEAPPDVVTCAKALGGGVPLGAMLCNARYDVFTPGDHATTYGGNPLACAAGLAVARAIDDDGLVENARDRGDQLLAGLARLRADYPDLVLDVRGRGLLLGLQLAKPLASQLVALCADNGLLLVPAGPSVLRFVPPLVVTEAQVDAALDILQLALADFALLHQDDLD